MRKSVSAIAGLLSCVLCFVGLKYLVVDSAIGWDILVNILGEDSVLLESNLFMLALLATPAVLAGILIYQLCRNRLNLVYLRVLGIVYALAAVVVIMLKSSGIRIGGVNLNFLDIVTQFEENPLTLLVNLFILLPLGCCAALEGYKLWKSALVSLAGILVCETLQPILSLGFFDIVDITLNELGFIFGMLVVSVILGSRTRKREGNWISFGKQPENSDGEVAALQPVSEAAC